MDLGVVELGVVELGVVDLGLALGVTLKKVFEGWAEGWVERGVIEGLDDRLAAMKLGMPWSNVAYPGSDDLRCSK